MESTLNLLTHSALQVWITLIHNWPFLIVSIVIAVGLKLFIDISKVSNFLQKNRNTGVVGATLVAVTTPFCSCGTTAVILGMMASTLPWAPIIAFMVSSPLTSPGELVYSAGLFGWPFALAFFISSIVLGLLGGVIGSILEKNNFLKNQSRFGNTTNKKSELQQLKPSISKQNLITTQMNNHSLFLNFSMADAQVGSTSYQMTPLISNTTPCGCSVEQKQPQTITSDIRTGNSDGCLTGCTINQTKSEQIRLVVTWKAFLTESFIIGKRLLIMFIGFAFIGYVINGLIPPELVGKIFGQANIYSVVLASTLGLPLYINTEASLPLVKALIEGGMSQGAALAFLITGVGTSIGAFTGALTIARWRVIATVVVTLWIGSIVIGYLYNFLLSTGLM
jgi:hypothetical protein